MSLLNILINRKNGSGKKDDPKSICPYCNKVLLKFPGRKTKCLHCGKYIYSRTRPIDGQRILIRDDQIEQFEQERQSFFNVEEFKDNLISQCNSDFDKIYLSIKNKLTKEFGCEPSEIDILWGLSNFRLSELMKMGDWQTMKMIYSSQARFLYYEGKSFLRVLQEMYKCDLRNYAKSNIVKKVEIITCKENSCPSCQKLSGKVFTIEQALKEMPLPCKECSFELNPKSNMGWCRCFYAPLVD